jgi:hypothetical protein
MADGVRLCESSRLCGGDRLIARFTRCPLVQHTPQVPLMMPRISRTGDASVAKVSSTGNAPPTAAEYQRRRPPPCK